MLLLPIMLTRSPAGLLAFGAIDWLLALADAPLLGATGEDACALAGTCAGDVPAPCDAAG